MQDFHYLCTFCATDYKSPSKMTINKYCIFFKFVPENQTDQFYNESWRTKVTNTLLRRIICSLILRLVIEVEFKYSYYFKIIIYCNRYLITRLLYSVENESQLDSDSDGVGVLVNLLLFGLILIVIIMMVLLSLITILFRYVTSC